MELYTYKAKILSVYDGDTCTADIQLGFYVIAHKVKLRLYGINTPEIRGGTAETKKAGLTARDWLREQVLDKEVTIKSFGKGKYGRWLVELYLDDEETSLNQQLIDKGFAHSYLR